MSITDVVIELTCESLGCDKDLCSYKDNKLNCPKLLSCQALCDIFCPNPEEEDNERI